eukprot:scaffold52339_cov23-Tisochrysis_lutea.AAC.1
MPLLAHAAGVTEPSTGVADWDVMQPCSALRPRSAMQPCSTMWPCSLAVQCGHAVQCNVAMQPCNVMWPLCIAAVQPRSVVLHCSAWNAAHRLYIASLS